MLKICKVVFLFLLIMIFLLSLFGCESKPKRPVYLNMIYNFTQLSYKSVNFKQLNSPFTRFNVTQKIFGLAHRLKGHQQIHAAVNLNSALLNQLEKNYIERLKPNINLANEDFDVEKFRIQYLEKSDPWIDLLVTNSWEMDRKQRDFLYNWSGKQEFHCFSIDESVIERFPEYAELIPDNMGIGRFKGAKSRKDYTTEDRTRLKFLFNLVSFDPILLQGAVKLPIRNEQNESAFSKLHKWVKWEKGNPEDPIDDKYYLAKEITEKDCQQLVVEIYKILASIMPAYRQLIYDEKKERGQVELMLSSYENPVIALLQDSDAGKINNDDFALPSRYFFPEDASWQLRMGMAGFKSRFKNVPRGLWLDEGSVLKSMIPLFSNEGMQWIPVFASEKIKNDKTKMCNIYRIEDDKKSSVVTFLPVKSISEKFRNFINGKSENAEARKFLNEIIKYAPGKSKEPVVTIVYNQEDNSGTFKFSLQDWNFIDDFLYLADSLKTGNELITLTPIEYLRGNKKRKIIKHSTKTLTNLNEDDIKINFSDWIGDKEQNVAWEYLTIVRDVFEKMNLRYNPENPNTWIQKAWEEFYVAQNSKWFKWYQNNEKNTNDFRRDVDSNFRECLSRVFYYLNRAGFGLDVPEFPVLIQQEKKLKLDHPFESNPTINGRQDKIWASQGAYSADLDKTAEEDLIDRVFWGYDNDNIYFAIKSKKSSLEKAFKNNSLIMAVYSFPADVKRITVDEKMSNWGILRTSVKVKNSLDVFKFHKDSVTIASPDTTILVAVKNRFLELSIPLKKLKSKSENKKFFIQLWKDDKIEDYFPNSGFIEINTAN